MVPPAAGARDVERRVALLGSASAASRELHRGTMHRLNPVFALVAWGFADRISLDEAARSTNMSRTCFCRFFRRATGTTFVEYLNRYRVTQSKRLMLEGELTISQIEYRTGFRNVGYFSRVFRRFTRLAPSEFVSEQNGGPR